MGTLENDPNLWKTVVPVVFHVNYWDQLGWKDRFARPEFTERQQTYAQRWHSRSVYTPGLVWQGQEWRGWFQDRTRPEFAARSIGLLSLYENADRWLVRFQPSRSISPQTAHIALLGRNLVSQVQRGENAGRELRHSFVALEHRQLPLLQKADQLIAEFPILTTTAPRLAIAVWVENEQGPIQAAGQWLPDRP